MTTLRQQKDETVRRAMEVSRGNKSAAARLLGIDRKTLYKKLQELGSPIGPATGEKRGRSQEAIRRRTALPTWKLLGSVSGDPWPLVLLVCRCDTATELQMEHTETEAVLRAMEATRGNKSAAARLLGIDRKTLYKKLRGLA